MKIEHVTATQLRLPQVANVFDGTQDVLVVQVMTDSGETGLGEVVSSSYVAKGIIEAPRSGGGRHGLREAVLGMDATDIDAVWKHMYDATAWYGRRGVAIHAMSGIEMALWDLKGKAEGTPVYRLLGGTEVPPPQPRIRAYASVLWGDTLDATLANAQRLLEQGFSALKFGFGPFGLGDISEDVQTLKAVRQSLGDSPELMVDVGRKWSAERAVEECAALADAGLGWIEEPLHPDDLTGYRELCATSQVPIAGAETEETAAQFEDYLDAGLSVIQPDLGRCGLRTGMRLSAMARERGRRCVPHCFASGINTTAAIHWMAASGGDLVEYPMGDSPLRRDLVEGVPPLANGTVGPSDRPGLGVELNLELLERYA